MEPPVFFTLILIFAVIHTNADAHPSVEVSDEMSSSSSLSSHEGWWHFKFASGQM